MEKSVLEKIEVPAVQNKYNMTSTSAQYSQEHNGRVPNINDPSLAGYSARPYKLYSNDGLSIHGSDPRRELIGTMHKETPLNTVFFSLDNIDLIQKRIYEQVLLMSGNKYHIDRQNDDEVKLVMRSYYLMFGQNNPQAVSEELDDLNGRVVGYCAAKVFSEVDFHMFYRKDIEDFAPPIANPMNVKVFGTRTGELKSFF
jgi:hypothetical protein